MATVAMTTALDPRIRQAARIVLAAKRPRAAAADAAASDALLFAERYLKIRDKAGNIIPLRYNRVQQDFLANRTGRDLVLKARQHGLSTCVQAEHFRACISRTAVTVTLGHIDSSTQMLRRMTDLFYEALPADLAVRRRYSNATLQTYPATRSESIIATAGSKEIGRGGSYTSIHATEVAFYRDAMAIVRGLMEGGNPAIVMESTPNGAQGYFYELCMDVLDGRRTDWRLHFYPWWWSDEYAIALQPGETLSYTDDERQLAVTHGLQPEQIKWRRMKQTALGRDFLQEYPEDPRTCFLLSGVGYFANLPEAAFSAPLDAGPEHGHRYVAGLDFGQLHDFTALSIVDATTGLEVARLHVNKLPWATMRRRIVELCVRWNVTTLMPEGNSIGGVNIEELLAEFAKAEHKVRLVRFDTNNASKAEIMAAVHEALHSGALRLQADPLWRRELMAFTATQLPSGAWKLEAPAGEHDDTVIARALAWRAATLPVPSVKIRKGLG